MTTTDQAREAFADTVTRIAAHEDTAVPRALAPRITQPTVVVDLPTADAASWALDRMNAGLLRGEDPHARLGTAPHQRRSSDQPAERVKTHAGCLHCGGCDTCNAHADGCINDPQRTWRPGLTRRQYLFAWWMAMASAGVAGYALAMLVRG